MDTSRSNYAAYRRPVPSARTAAAAASRPAAINTAAAAERTKCLAAAEMTAVQVEQLMCESYKECEEWFNLFRALDRDSDGYIPTVELRQAVEHSAFSFGLSSEEAAELLFDVDANGDHYVDFSEFTRLMAKAKHLHMRRVMLYAARSVLPRSQQRDTMRYLLQYNCFPPPIFLVLISIVQVAVYLYYAIGSKEGISPTKPVPKESLLILNPFEKLQVWRYYTYMFIHVGYVHLLTNLAVQILLGIPLELVHKFWRVGLIYVLGVMSGALLFFVVEWDRDVYLAGASGGCYTLLSAQIANVVINWSEMEFNWLRALVLGVFVGADAVISVYQRYFDYNGGGSKVSYTSHIGGFIAGLLLGIVILRNLRYRTWEDYAWYIALGAYIFYTLTCIVMIVALQLMFKGTNGGVKKADIGGIMGNFTIG